MRKTFLLRNSAWFAALSGLSLLLTAGMVPGGAQGRRPVAKPASTAPAVPQPVRTLALTPAKITLDGLYAEARVLVEGRPAAGPALDVSGQATFSVADPKIAVVDEDGTVRPRGDGKTTLTARLKSLSVSLPVEVRGVAKAGAPRFLTDVMPVLTRTGCTQGACHGAGAGKGGFKLSLLGYDPEADYLAITRGGGVRRIVRVQPEASLFLRKPALQVVHKGGLRFKVDSSDYRLLRDWIAKGMPGPQPTEPRVVRLEMIPPIRTLAVGQTQRFIVRARYSDGTVRDVTEQTVFTASDETVAKVTPDGEAKAVGPGEGAVLIRYQSLVATARVISPFSKPQQAKETLGEGMIDRLINRKLAALGLPTSGPARDAEFLRRATLDVTGLLPTPEEVRAFLADRDPKKREKLVDSLLERGEYVDFWAMKWGDLLRSTRRSLSHKGMVSLNHWIRRSVAENKPWDQFAREILLAEGSTFINGQANFFRTATTPETLAETTSQAFLGVRIQCARCHNHPYEKWTQNQYYQMASFFARVRTRKGEGDNEQFVFLAKNGEVKHPKTQKAMVPTALDAAPVPVSFQGDRRQALADWLTSPKNPFFARIIVNRVWKHYMGRGLVEPVDDMRATNPPSNEPLLDWLAQDFVKNGYDLKRLMRRIMLSQAYQRSPEPVKGNERDARYYSHYPFKRLGAEPLMDAIASATGVPEKFEGFPVGLHASQLPDTTVPSYFLELFGRPARNITCECERVDEPNLGQILHLMNNQGINGRIAAKTGRVASLLEAKLPDNKVIEELYLATYSRYPTPEESRKGVPALSKAKDRKAVAEDLLWALMNSKEFFFNH